MHSLKFRAWANGYKKYCEYVEYTDGVWIGYIKAPKGLMSTTNVVIEQSTGLKDRNGKEIYEGDIFRNTINDVTWRVSWSEDGASFWVNSEFDGCSLGEFNWNRSKREYGFISKNCEVIGNIHENGDLLGGEE